MNDVILLHKMTFGTLDENLMKAEPQHFVMQRFLLSKY